MNVAINKVAVTVRISTVAAVAVTEATVKQVLGISLSGSATKYLNEQGNFTTPAGGGGSVAWGGITGSLIAQTDLQTALNGKQASLGFTPANKAGDTFTGAISATNLSGTNTGDETQNTIKTKLGAASASQDGYLTSANWSTFNGKQDSLGFTPENVSNKSTSVTTDQASNTKYPSVKAVYDWVIGLGYITASALTGYATEAWVAAQGYITNVVTALGYTPENVANKSTTLSADKASDTKYPSVKSVYDFYQYNRSIYQTTAETSLTGTTSETLIDSILIPANTLSANDIVQIAARTLKTTTAAGTLRIYINSSGSLSGATLLGSFQMSAAVRFAGFERNIAVKASGLIEVLSATNTASTTDSSVVQAVETTTTVTLSNNLYLLTSMQLGNSADTMRRSFCQVQIQRAL